MARGTARDAFAYTVEQRVQAELQQANSDPEHYAVTVSGDFNFLTGIQGGPSGGGSLGPMGNGKKLRKFDKY